MFAFHLDSYNVGPMARVLIGGGLSPKSPEKVQSRNFMANCLMA